MAKNDWIVAGLNNPEFNNDDFRNIADMSTGNTQLLDKDQYLKSNFIINNPAFRDDKGKFSESKFNDYYKKRVQDFGDFQEQEAYQGPAVDMFSIDRTANTPVQDIQFDIKRGVNPDRQAIGIEGVNVWSAPTLSKREIAKQNKVFNTATNKFEDYTVNDHALVSNPIEWFKDLFSDPLVFATYDEDGTHLDPLTGLVKEHKKGDAKLNNKGTYYYETLNGRSVLGKDVLSTFDTFTVDGKGINKYDFFDSNDIEKSVTGTVMKNITAIAPLFAGPVVAGVYASALIGREFSKTLPMLYGMATALTDSDTPSWINTLAAKASSATTSTSDYGKENAFSFENFGSLVTDVALQWGQQKAIASAFQKVKGAPNYIKEAEDNAKALYNVKRVTQGDSEELWQACVNKFLPAAQKKAEAAGQLGRDMSLAYMAIVSNTDVYSDALEHGASKKEAAAIALGSTIGMFSFDKYTGIGELFFDDATGDATKAARQALKNEFRNAQGAFKTINSTEAPAKNKLAQIIRKSADTSKKALSKFSEDLKYHTTSMSGKMLGEGLEEVGEELISDVSKSMYELAGAFGFDTSTTDVGAWDNAYERYVMSFLGGAVGGGVFYGKEVWDKGSFHKPKLDEDIATLIRNGHADELRKQLSIMNKENKTGNKSLSASDYEVTEDNKVVWKTTDDESASQSQAVMNLVNDRINSIEEILIGNRANLSDEELFDNMVLSEKRYNRYKEIAPLTNYYQDFTDILNNVVNDEMAYRKAGKTLDGTVGGNVVPNDTALNHLTEQQRELRAKNLESLRLKLEGSRLKMQEFLSGNTSLDYTRKLNFAMDSALHTPFLAVNKEEYLQKLYPGKTIDQLPEQEQMRFNAIQWPEYVQEQLKTRLTEAWDKFKEFEKNITPHLHALSEGTAEYKGNIANLTKLFTTKLLDSELLTKHYLTENDRVGEESDELYESRNKKMTDPITGELETDDAFEARKAARKEAIRLYNAGIDQGWADLVEQELQKVGYKVDPQTARKIRKSIPESGRLHTLFANVVDNLVSDPKLARLLSGLKYDLSNVDELMESIKEQELPKFITKLDNLFKKIQNIKITLKDGEQVDWDNIVKDNPEWYGYSLQELLDDIETNLEDPDAYTNIEALSEDSLRSLKAVVEEILQETPMDLSGVDAADIVTGETSGLKLKDKLLKAMEPELNSFLNDINVVVDTIKSNPLYQLQQKLNNSIINPIGELLKQVAEANGDDLPDVDRILDTIQDNFDNLEDIHQLQLDDTERASLEKARDYMKLLQVYLYAAATTPNSSYPVGHNRTANAFAESHADKLRTPWEKLPEIDSDYVALYMQSLNEYIQEADYWIALSDMNSINKIEKFARTDMALSKALWGVLAKLPRSFQYQGKTLDLLEGMDTIDSSALDSPTAQVPLYALERLVYKNINQFAANNGLTVAQLMEGSNLLETLIPGIGDVGGQKSSSITDVIDTDSVTDYDKMLYLMTIFSSDPSLFYGDLNKRVTAESLIAPVAVQEFSVRIAKASETESFRQMFAHARTLMPELEAYTLTNTVIVPGVAGSGKTQVIFKSIDSSHKDKKVFLAAPTAWQAATLQKAMERDSSMNFEDLMNAILGKDQWARVKAEYESKATKDGFDTEHMSMRTGSDGISKLHIKPDAFTFNDVDEAPAAIYIDEATHLSTLQAEIIDAYARKKGIQVFMCGDPTQMGHSDMDKGVQNIDEAAVFSVRTPSLTIALRDNNLQKYQNLNAIKAVLDLVIKSRLDDTVQDYKALFPTLENMYSVLNFRVYNGTELNGDMITQSIDDGTIAKLKEAVNAGKSIAFIGDDNSAHLRKLADAGVVIPKDNLLNLSTMQGQEFDYVLIDESFEKPVDTPTALWFLQKVYTLMSRSREASIFIDNGLSGIIGKNVISQSKSKAPSIKEGISRLVEKKREILNQLDYSPIEIAGLPTPSNKAPMQNPDLDFTDPDTRTDEETKEAVTTLASSDSSTAEKSVPVNLNEEELLKQYPIECYGDVTILSVDKVEDVTRKDKKGREHTNALWNISYDKEASELRNLQALLTVAEKRAGGTEAFWYSEKINLQKRLYNLKSTLLFGHKWPSGIVDSPFPNIIMQNFNKEDWEAGTYELEFRTPSSQDVPPVHGNLQEVGMDYNGQKIIANVVFKVKNKEGKTCKFDLGGINSPKTFMDSRGALKAKYAEALNNPKLDDATKDKLQKLHDGLEAATLAYENWFAQQVKTFNEKGSLSLDVTHSVHLSQSMWFKKRLRGDGSVSPIRLGGYINPDDLDKTDSKSLMLQNPDKVFSPVYTFTGNEADFYKLDSSIAGKAVIFVTSDTLLDSSKLLDEYLKQKADPENHTPRVRMIVLNNYGLSFSQLNNPKYLNAFKQQEEDRKPLRQNFTGLRMFASLWNARAALLKFNEAYAEWKNANGFTEEQVHALMQAEYMLYSGESEEKVDALLKSVNVTREHLKALAEFNNGTCKDIPMFRLGYSVNNNGFHLQEFSVKDSTAYTGLDKANLCVITPEKALQFTGLLHGVIMPICPGPKAGPLTRENTLGLKLTKPGPNGTTVEWEETEFINFEQANHRRTLSGLLNLDGSVLKIESTDDEGNKQSLAFAEGEHWSIIPMLISKLTRAVSAEQHSGTESGKTTTKLSYPTTTANGKQGEDKSIPLDLWVFIGPDGLLSPTSEDGEVDQSLFHVLDLVFHGTIEDIHRPVGDGKTLYTNPDGTKEVRSPLMQLTDAYFKKGFFVNPDITRKTSGTDASDVVGKVGHKGQMLFFELSINPALLTADVDMRSTGLQLSLGGLMEGVPTAVKVENAAGEEVVEEDLQEQFQKEHPVVSQAIDRLNRLRPGYVLPYADVSINEAIRDFNTLAANEFKTVLNMKSSHEALSYPYKITADEKMLPYKQYLEMKYPGAKVGIKDQDITLIMPDGKLYAVNKDNGELVLVDQVVPVKNTLSLFNDIYKGTTVGKAVENLLNSPEFIETSKENGVEDDKAVSFAEALHTAIELGNTLTDSDAPLKTMLEDILSNEDYAGVLDTLAELDQDLFDIIFLDC
jgi:hypothetical protein|uniref:Helicase n=1 Tax=Podoviridae sp. ctz6O13 TaxID=2827757 RepID=A0A8S5TKT5_9CAUD|nr:MAG TPA: Helicase [Podoviridae sp. ctz6O13]